MHLRILLPLFLLSSVATAQQVTLRGKVEDGPGRSQFLVDCTSTELVSSAVNLADFLGQDVLIRGTFVGTPAAPSVKVTSIARTPEIFEIPGKPEVGQTMRFGATYTPGSLVTFHVALQPGFTSVGKAGTLFLSQASRIKVASGVIPPLGNLELSVPMPNNPALIGRTAYAQAVLVTGTRVVVSNPDCKTIE